MSAYREIWRRLVTGLKYPTFNIDQCQRIGKYGVDDCQRETSLKFEFVKALRIWREPKAATNTD